MRLTDPRQFDMLALGRVGALGEPFRLSDGRLGANAPTLSRARASQNCWRAQPMDGLFGYVGVDRLTRQFTRSVPEWPYVTPVEESFSMASQFVARSEPVSAFIPALELLVTEAMDEWKIPGLAVAVVQNGEVALLGAYGLRDVEAGLKVTTDTQFLIGSITKSFTSTGLALLVDERRLDWKKPVRDYIPEFRLHDAVATDRITVRDLLCHHSGLPRHDWIWVPGDLSPAQMLAAMRYLEPSDDVRSTFQYSNLGYFVASMVTERISGQSWNEFTRARLTDRLHMNVTFTVEDLAAAADAAMPYAMDGDTRLRSNFGRSARRPRAASTPQLRTSRTGFACISTRARLKENGYYHRP